MGLPKINETNTFTQFKLPSGKTIGVKGWKVKEEKELLFAAEKINENNVEDKVKIILNFLRNCVDDQNKYDYLSENDLKKVAIESRKIAKGDDIEFTQRCTKQGCGFILEDSIKLSRDEKITFADLSPLKVNDSLTLAFKELPLNDLLKLQTRFKDEYSKLLYYFIVNSIEAITYEGTVYTEFTEDDAIEFIDSLSPNDLEIIFKEFEKKNSKIELYKKVKCLRCQEEIEVKVDDILSFLLF